MAKKKKAKMPVDIGAVMDTLADLGQARDLKAFINVVIDVTASDTLIDAVLQAFDAPESSSEVRMVLMADAAPELPLPADLCVIVGAESLLLGDVASDARRMGTPAVVVIEQGVTFFFEEDPEQLDEQQTEEECTAIELPHKGIPIGDIVAADFELARPLDELAEWIIGHAPAKRLSMALDFPFMRMALASQVIEGTSLQCGAIGLLVFIPGADMPVITLNQARMVLQIASVYGFDMDLGRVKEILAVVASAFGMRAVARELSGAVPFLGWGIKSGVAYFGTQAIGRAALDYFEGDGVFSSLSEALSAAADQVMETITEASTELVDIAAGAYADASAEPAAETE